MWQRLAEIKFECGPRLERLFHMAGGAASATTVAAAGATLPVLPALALSGLVGTAGAWFQSCATRSAPDPLRGQNHDLTRCFRLMVLSRLPQDCRGEAERNWPPGSNRNLPSGVENSLGPAIAGLFAFVGRVSPFDQDPVPSLPWSDQREWESFLRELCGPAVTMAEEYCQHGLFWFLWEVRHDAAATAALEQYVAMAILNHHQDLAQSQAQQAEILQELGVTIADLQALVARNHADVLEKLDRIEGLLTGFEHVGKILERCKDDIPDRVHALTGMPSWAEVARGYVFERRLVGPLRECLEGEGLRVFPISAPSGSGKSTFLMWAAIWCFRDRGLPTFYCPDGETAKIHPDLPKNAILVIDHAAELGPTPKRFLEGLHRNEFEGVLIIADQDVCWKGSSMRALKSDRDPHSLAGLDQHEVDRLTDLLRAAGTESDLQEQPVELLPLLIRAIRRKSISAFVSDELANLAKSYDKAATDFEPALNAIIAVSWFGISDKICPDQALLGITPPDYMPLLRNADSIIPATLGGRKSRHRLFAEAILESEELRRVQVINKLIPEVLAVTEALSFDVGQPILYDEVLMRCIDACQGFPEVNSIVERIGQVKASDSLLPKAIEIADRIYAESLSGATNDRDRDLVFEEYSATLRRLARTAAEYGLKLIDEVQAILKRSDEKSRVFKEFFSSVDWISLDATSLLDQVCMQMLGDQDLLAEAAKSFGAMGQNGVPLLEQLANRADAAAVVRFAASGACSVGPEGVPVIQWVLAYPRLLELSSCEDTLRSVISASGVQGSEAVDILVESSRLLAELPMAPEDLIGAAARSAAMIGPNSLSVLEQLHTLCKGRKEPLKEIMMSAEAMGPNSKDLVEAIRTELDEDFTKELPRAVSQIVGLFGTD